MMALQNYVFIAYVLCVDILSWIKCNQVVKIAVSFQDTSIEYLFEAFLWECVGGGGCKGVRRLRWNSSDDTMP